MAEWQDTEQRELAIGILVDAFGLDPITAREVTDYLDDARRHPRTGSQLELLRTNDQVRKAADEANEAVKAVIADAVAWLDKVNYDD